ncbi:hypothetical protein C6P43_001703 [Kluyveromyces marxianus]|nr:hypothetical protein C6P43_001703 [Kluyveromyces marxianus]
MAEEQSKYYKQALEEYQEMDQEDPDAWDKRITNTGCYVENLALQLCHAETNDWRQSDMNKSSLGVIKKKKSNLKRLTGVLKDLLVKESSPKSEEDQDYKTPPKTRKDGVVYILSKENRLIPKLSDEEIMERHRKADENMKRVWSEIIAKYENIEDQGDTIDLRTEEDTNQDSKLIKEAEVEEEEFLEEPDSDNDYTSESYHNIARER